MVAAGSVAMVAVSLAIEQTIRSGPVWSSLEVGLVGALSLVALVAVSVALASAAALDNRGGAQ